MVNCYSFDICKSDEQVECKITLCTLIKVPIIYTVLSATHQRPETCEKAKACEYRESETCN